MKEQTASSSIVGIVGSGAMGSGIAQVAAADGHPVKLYDTRPEAVEKAIAGIQKTFQMLSEKGRMTAAEADSAGRRLSAAASLSALADASLVVEAIVENLDVKLRLFSDLEAIVDESCILATNTSSISITTLAAELRRLAAQYAERPALETDDLGRALSYVEVLAHAERLAAGMAARGICAGTRVLTRLQNDSCQCWCI